MADLARQRAHPRARAGSCGAPRRAGSRRRCRPGRKSSPGRRPRRGARRSAPRARPAAACARPARRRCGRRGWRATASWMAAWAWRAAFSEAMTEPDAAGLGLVRDLRADHFHDHGKPSAAAWAAALVGAARDPSGGHGQAGVAQHRLGVGFAERARAGRRGRAAGAPARLSRRWRGTAAMASDRRRGSRPARSITGSRRSAGGSSRPARSGVRPRGHRDDGFGHRVRDGAIVHRNRIQHRADRGIGA